MARHREFDEKALLAQAMQAFWSHAYRGMAIEALIAETGVSRASLHTAYTVKRGIFVEGIKRYLEEFVEGSLRRGTFI